MISIVVFAVVLAVVGGFIAWLGDWLGTKIGKKRISFRGLRPRHTAMVATIISGGLISLLTLMVLIVSDNTFKRALLEGPRLILQNESFRRQIEEQQAKARANEKNAQEKARQLDEAQRKLAPVQQSLGLVQQRLGLKQQQLVRAQTSLGAATQQLDSARRKVGAAARQVQAEQRRVVAAQRQVSSVKGQVRDLQARRRSLIASNRELRNDAEFFRTKVANSTFGDLIYHKYEEVGRAVIATGQSPQAIQKDLARFLHDLGREAVARGGLKNGAIVLALPSQTRESQAIKALSQNIADEPGKVGSVVIIARAGANAFKGNAVHVVLTPYENARIYTRNAVVATQAVDGNQTDSQIVDALQSFLTHRVRTAALQRGLLPLTDPQTGARLVGAIDKTTVLPLVRQIQQVGAGAQVTAYADVDTDRSGPVPLQLHFDVTPALPAQARPASATGGKGP